MTITEKKILQIIFIDIIPTIILTENIFQKNEGLVKYMNNLGLCFLDFIIFSYYAINILCLVHICEKMLKFNDCVKLIIGTYLLGTYNFNINY